MTLKPLSVYPFSVTFGTRHISTYACDGKGMAASNHSRGRKCWLCRNKVETMNPDPHIHDVLRYGAFLPTIPADRRIGDHVHATARISNIILSRQEGMNHSTLNTLIRNIRQKLSEEAAQLSVEDRIGWRPRTPNQIDLSQAKLFMNSLTHHTAIVDCIRQSILTRVVYKERETSIHILVQIILSLFRKPRAFWQQRTILTPVEIEQYCSHAHEFGLAWRACSWKSTLWVHWLVEHSPILVQRWRNIA